MTTLRPPTTVVHDTAIDAMHAKALAPIVRQRPNSGTTEGRAMSKPTYAPTAACKIRNAESP
jgi:hypothetical protein